MTPSKVNNSALIPQAVCWRLVHRSVLLPQPITGVDSYNSHQIPTQRSSRRKLLRCYVANICPKGDILCMVSSETGHACSVQQVAIVRSVACGRSGAQYASLLVVLQDCDHFPDFSRSRRLFLYGPSWWRCGDGSLTSKNPTTRLKHARNLQKVARLTMPLTKECSKLHYCPTRSLSSIARYTDSSVPVVASTNFHESLGACNCDRPTRIGQRWRGIMKHGHKSN